MFAKYLSLEMFVEIFTLVWREFLFLIYHATAQTLRHHPIGRLENLNTRYELNAGESTIG